MIIIFLEVNLKNAITDVGLVNKAFVTIIQYL